MGHRRRLLINKHYVCVCGCVCLYLVPVLLSFFFTQKSHGRKDAPETAHSSQRPMKQFLTFIGRSATCAGHTCKSTAQNLVQSVSETYNTVGYTRQGYGVVERNDVQSTGLEPLGMGNAE